MVTKPATSSQTLSGYIPQSAYTTPARQALRHTKIVCTIGPACSSQAMVTSLAQAGMDIARLNFSHGTHDEHLAALDAVRSASEAVGRPLAVMADLCGPKIRVSGLDTPIAVERGGTITLSAESSQEAGDLRISFVGIADCVAPLDPVLIDDGLVRLSVIDVRGTRVRCRVEEDGVIHPNKGVNLPRTTLPIPALTAKDILDLEFALAQGVDAVALSFVRSADDIRELRDRVDAAGSGALLVAKIEKSDAVDQLESIIDAADAVMVARGDLGVEIGVSKVPMVQKRIITLAQRAGRAVITATQMLESMITRSEPTRAEVSDVANAILDGTSAVMLSAETATGKFPLAAVRSMDAIAREVEPTLPPAGGDVLAFDLPGVLSSAACGIADRLGAAVIAVPTVSGATVREVVRSRPRQPVMAASSDPSVLRRLVLEWGVVPVEVAPSATAEALWRGIVDAARERDLAGPGELMVFAGRTELSLPGETTHVLVHEIRSES